MPLSSLVIPVDADSLDSTVLSAAVCNGYRLKRHCVLRKCCKGAPSLTNHHGAARLEPLLHLQSEVQRMTCSSNHRAPLINSQLVRFHLMCCGNEQVTRCWNITLGLNTCSMLLWERSRYRRRSGWAARWLLFFLRWRALIRRGGQRSRRKETWPVMRKMGHCSTPGSGTRMGKMKQGFSTELGGCLYYRGVIIEVQANWPDLTDKFVCFAWIFRAVIIV